MEFASDNAGHMSEYADGFLNVPDMGNSAVFVVNVAVVGNLSAAFCIERRFFEYGNKQVALGSGVDFLLLERVHRDNVRVFGI